MNAQRLKVYPRLFVLIWILAAMARGLQSRAMVDANGTVLGDFLTFYAGAKLAAAGHAAWAYDLSHMLAAEQAVISAAKFTAWFYPPSFFFMVRPLAALPFFLAYALFMGVTLVLYVWAFRVMTKQAIAMWCLAAFPGLWMNLLHGQNAFLTAALAAGACLLLPRKPLTAGAMVGCLLATKPHLALLFPVVLIADRAWLALMSALATAAGLSGAAIAVFGVSTIKPFLAAIAFARGYIEDGRLPWSKMPSTFAMLRIWHAPVPLAYAGQALMAVLASFAVWKIWRRSNDSWLRGTVLMAGTFLVTPYVFDYDLAWLAFPIAWSALLGLRDGWMRFEREILVAVWILPFAMAGFTQALFLQPGPIVLALLLWNAVRRGRAGRVEARSAFA
jgi:hypothetical protein